ncbi:MAG: hypothetical protein JXR76_04510 [Deltaproteobacteria bacterium]|nr:hypothetical protein [Deltaproteobacteria bacterium]
MTTEVSEDRVRWIEYKGQRILKVDFSGLSKDEGIPLLYREAEMMQHVSGKVKTLVDVRNGKAGSEYMKHARKLGKEVFFAKTEKQAMIGVGPAQMVLLRAYNFFTGAGRYQEIFNTEAEALEWLVSS